MTVQAEQVLHMAVIVIPLTSFVLFNQTFMADEDWHHTDKFFLKHAKSQEQLETALNDRHV